MVLDSLEEPSEDVLHEFPQVDLGTFTSLGDLAVVHQPLEQFQHRRLRKAR